MVIIYDEGGPMRRTLALVLLAVGAAASLSAGERESARGVGMARTFTATARGLDAVGINPANLDPEDGNFMQIDFLPLGIHVGSNFLSYDLYTTYFTGIDTGGGRIGRYLSASDKQKILDAFPNGNGLFSMNADVRTFGAAVSLGFIGTFAFTISEHGGGMMNIPRDYVALMLNGNMPGSTLDFSNTNVKAAWTREYTLSYGRSLPPPPFLKSLKAGVGLKVVHGFAYADVERFNTSLTTASNGALSGTVDFLARTSRIDELKGNDNNNNSNSNPNNPDNPYNPPPSNPYPGNMNNNSGNNNNNDNGSKFTPFPAPAGSAFAMDLGVAGAINEFLSFGMSITDIGSMTWSSNVEQKTADTTVAIDDLFSSTQRDALENAVKVRDVASGSFSAHLPTQFRLGVALAVDKLPSIVHFPGQLTVALDYNQGFHDTYASTTNARVSLGAEYIPAPIIPIRTGVSFGGTDRVNLAFGFGLHFGAFQLDLASENVSWLFDPSSFSYGSFAMGMRFNI